MNTSMSPAAARASKEIDAFLANSTAESNTVEFWFELCTEFFLKRFALSLINDRMERPMSKDLVRVLARVFRDPQQAVPSMANIDKLIVVVEEVHA